MSSMALSLGRTESDSSLQALCTPLCSGLTSLCASGLPIGSFLPLRAVQNCSQMNEAHTARSKCTATFPPTRCRPHSGNREFLSRVNTTTQ